MGRKFFECAELVCGKSKIRTGATYKVLNNLIGFASRCDEVSPWIEGFVNARNWCVENQK